MKTGYLNYRWYPREVAEPWGQWVIMPIDEEPDMGVEPVAYNLTRELAEHIADVHNTWLREFLGGEINPAIVG